MREANERDADRLLDRALVLTSDEIRGLTYRYREIAVTQTGVLPPPLGGRSMESSESRARAIVGPEWTARIEARATDAIDRARHDGRVSRLRSTLDWTYASLAVRAISNAALAVAAGPQLDETDQAVLKAPWTQAVGPALVPSVDARSAAPLKSGARIRRRVLVITFVALIPIVLLGLVLAANPGLPG